MIEEETTPADDVAAPSDPLGLIEAAVREVVTGPQADALVAQIGQIIATAPADDLERIAVENAQLQHELEVVQNVDSLTGLRNRHRFFEDLTREVTEARRHDSTLTLLVFDVDGLRDVNETRGFDAGDRLLLTLSELLLTRLRVTDIAARIGDDDFAVILPRTPLVGAERLAERIGEALGDWVDMGLAELEGSVTSGGELLERADRDLAARRSSRFRPSAA